MQRQGKRAGSRHQRLLEKRRYNLNWGFYHGKCDIAGQYHEVVVLRRNQRNLHECSVMCFTDTWLQEDALDPTTINSIQTVQVDRNTSESGKKRLNGISASIKNR